MQQARAILQVAATSTLLGWASLHFFWDVPYRTFLWSESLSSGWVQALLGMNWKDYATSPIVDLWIQTGIQLIGLFLAICAAAAALAHKRRSRLLIASSASLAIVSLLLFKEAGYQLAMGIEYASQVLAPFFVYLAFSSRARPEKLLLLAKLAVAATFAGHGLYALGYYAVPGHFIDMTISILGVDETQARALLRVAGVADLAVALGVFLPATARVSLLYAAAWGLLTTLARPTNHIALGGDLAGLLYWSAEAICRVPHVAVPLAAFVLVRTDAKARVTELPNKFLEPLTNV
jgi:hypothetical protein